MKSPAILAMAAVLGLTACSGAPSNVTEITSLRFGATGQPQGVARSNAELTQDFIDLTFNLESGEELDGLLRYETPVRVYLASPSLAPYRRDLTAILDRLRREADIDISETFSAADANIVIEAVPAAEISRIFPTAACFIVPGETSWKSFLRRRPDARLRWSGQDTLTRSAIFLPVDTTPQDVRDCLNEEITQALGPANDLYRLPDSVWNDDNFHGMATSFDMLILRALYQPELESGMDRAEVAARMPGVLARVNPPGRGQPARPRAPEDDAWAAAIEVALARTTPRRARMAAATDATRMAAAMQPPDHRLTVSLLTLGRLSLRDDPRQAANHFTEAYRQSSRRYGTDDLRTAQAGIHMAALALGIGENETALTLARRHEDTAIRAQNAILAAGFQSIRAEALLRLDRPEEAQAARLDSLRWARYGFGDSNGALAREQAQLAALMRLEDG